MQSRLTITTTRRNPKSFEEPTQSSLAALPLPRAHYLTPKSALRSRDFTTLATSNVSTTLPNNHKQLCLARDLALTEKKRCDNLEPSTNRSSGVYPRRTSDRDLGAYGSANKSPRCSAGGSRWPVKD